MLFRASIYSLNSKTGKHYNEFKATLESETPISLKEDLQTKGYSELESDDTTLVMTRPVGYTDTEFIICAPINVA